MPPQSGSPEPCMQQALQEGYLRLAQGDRQGGLMHSSCSHCAGRLLPRAST